jgi:hypothetical protein
MGTGTGTMAMRPCTFSPSTVRGDLIPSGQCCESRRFLSGSGYRVSNGSGFGSCPIQILNRLLTGQQKASAKKGRLGTNRHSTHLAIDMFCSIGTGIYPYGSMSV